MFVYSQILDANCKTHSNIGVEIHFRNSVLQFLLVITCVAKTTITKVTLNLHNIMLYGKMIHWLCWE